MSSLLGLSVGLQLVSGEHNSTPKTKQTRIADDLILLCIMYNLIEPLLDDYCEEAVRF